MKQKPWYIWFSIPAFLMLAVDTMWKVLYSIKNPLRPLKTNYDLNLWLKVIGQLFFNMTILIIVPMILVLHFFEYLASIAPDLLQTLEFMQLLILYVFGVCAAYRQEMWRRKNISKVAKDKNHGDGTVG